MRGGVAEVSGLAFAEAGLADGPAGFKAGGAEEAGNLLEVKLDGVGAEDFGLREVCAGVPDLGHSLFEASDVAFKVEVGRGDVEAPAVNAFCDVLEA